MRLARGWRCLSLKVFRGDRASGKRRQPDYPARNRFRVVLITRRRRVLFSSSFIPYFREGNSSPMSFSNTALWGAWIALDRPSWLILTVLQLLLLFC